MIADDTGEAQFQKNCPNCGSALKFDPETGALRCVSCGSGGDSAIPAGAVGENDFLAMLNRLDEEAEAVEEIPAACSNCGAELTLPPNTASMQCPYCRTPIVASGASRRMIRPGGVLPFALTKEQARQALCKWIGSRPFAPGALKKQACCGEPEGVFLPYWTYDSTVTTAYTGARGEYYYVQVEETVTVNGKQEKRTRTERRTRWFPAAGTVRNLFDDILVGGGSSLPEKIVAKLEPWDTQNVVPYDADLIRGFREECYRVRLQEGFIQAQRAMEDAIEMKVRGDIGGDEQTIHSLNKTYSGISYKLLLLPVWVCPFRFRNKSYLCTVNARTGEVQGERPVSAGKVVGCILLVLALAALAIGLYLKFA